MTPLRFEEMYSDVWTELEVSLDVLAGRTREDGPQAPVSAARVAALYRRVCEHLALARERAYPAYIVDRLARVTGEAHQVIYQQREFGLSRVRKMIRVDFPAAVRRDWKYLLVSTATFLVPALVVGVIVYRDPAFILSVVSSRTAADFDEMYSPSAESIGRMRDASTDWMMFGYYIRNNIGVGFQCFASGLFAGLGSLFFLAYNGAFSGALAGYLTARGLSATFYSFIATHSAFELTAIVIAGSAGLKIGHALLAPRRLTRLQALMNATRESAVLIYGVMAMLLVAAAVEAFWSSARWLDPSIKYGVAAACWITVFAYFLFQGRRAS